MSPPQSTANSSPPVADRDFPADPFLSYPRSQSIVVTAIGRHKLLIFLLAALLGAAGVAAGYKRKSIWTATSTLQIGANINPSSPGFAGFVQSETNLATTFSRAITANGVLSKVKARTHLSPAASAPRLTATPVPNGAALEVIATGPNATSAIGLANAAGKALVAYEAPGKFVSPANALYDAYGSQSTVVAQARAHLQVVENNLRQSVTGSATTGNPTNPALVRAQAALDQAQARASALSAAYTQAVESNGSSGALLTPLAGAVTASSDRTHKMELLGFVGLAAGLLIAASIAILREQRRARPISPQ